MKKLVTITGAPATTGMVAKDVVLQLGKVAVVWVASLVIHKAAFNAAYDRSTRIDWNHPAFKNLK